jgi:hypothetical protein
VKDFEGKTAMIYGINVFGDAVMIDDDSRIRFTTSPFGRVMGRCYNISIRFHIVDNLMS